MRPKLLDELDQQGYVEVYREQIEKYLKVDRLNESIYLQIKYVDDVIDFQLDTYSDYKEEVIKEGGWFSEREVKYIKTSDTYNICHGLKIYFNINIINKNEEKIDRLREIIIKNK